MAEMPDAVIEVKTPWIPPMTLLTSVSRGWRDSIQAPESVTVTLGHDRSAVKRKARDMAHRPQVDAALRAMICRAGTGRSGVVKLGGIVVLAVVGAAGRPADRARFGPTGRDRRASVRRVRLGGADGAGSEGRRPEGRAGEDR